MEYECAFFVGVAVGFVCPLPNVNKKWLMQLELNYSRTKKTLASWF